MGSPKAAEMLDFLTRYCYALATFMLIMSRAKFRHCPHFGLHPMRAYTSLGRSRSERVASRNSFSRMALQIQTIIDSVDSVNANWLQ
jgi:hypothetical protein